MALQNLSNATIVLHLVGSLHLFVFNSLRRVSSFEKGVKLWEGCQALRRVSMMQEAARSKHKDKYVGVHHKVNLLGCIQKAIDAETLAWKYVDFNSYNNNTIVTCILLSSVDVATTQTRATRTRTFLLLSSLLFRPQNRRRNRHEKNRRLVYDEFHRVSSPAPPRTLSAYNQLKKLTPLLQQINFPMASNIDQVLRLRDKRCLTELRCHIFRCRTAEDEEQMQHEIDTYGPLDMDEFARTSALPRELIDYCLATNLMGAISRYFHLPIHRDYTM